MQYKYLVDTECIIISEKTIKSILNEDSRTHNLVNMAKKRTNIIPIIADARKPQEYRFLVGMVDVVFADVAQPDQARIMGINC